MSLSSKVADRYLAANPTFEAVAKDFSEVVRTMPYEKGLDYVSRGFDLAFLGELLLEVRADLSYYMAERVSEFGSLGLSLTHFKKTYRLGEGVDDYVSKGLVRFVYTKNSQVMCILLFSNFKDKVLLSEKFIVKFHGVTAKQLAQNLVKQIKSLLDSKSF